MPSLMSTGIMANSQNPLTSIMPASSSGISSKFQPMVFGPQAILISEKKIASLAELLNDYQEPIAQKDDRKRKLKIKTILQWVECFNAYVAVIAKYYPALVPDLLAYSSTIVHAARKVQGDGWLAYDSNFRKFIAQNRSAKWTEIHGSFWSLAFSTQKPNEHCTICFSLDHPTMSCPDYTKASDPNPYPICRRWNFSNCDITTCQYKYKCLDCGENHKVCVCPKTAKSTRYNPYPPRDRPQYPKGQHDLFRSRYKRLQLVTLSPLRSS